MLPARPLADPADVEIVGGGITGVSAALALARKGKHVRLHEARAIASGASGRNGGFALRGGAMAYDSAREWLGRGAAADYWRLTEAYVDRMAELGGDAIRRTGSLRLAGDDECGELRAEYEATRQRLGQPLPPLGGEAVLAQSSRRRRRRRSGSRVHWTASRRRCSGGSRRSRIAGRACSGSCPT